MAVVDELIGVLGYRLEGEQNLKKFKGGLDSAEKSAKSTADRVRSIGRAAGIVTTAAIAIGGKAVKDFANFERAMVRIGITAGATADQTAAASRDVQNLSSKFALPLEQTLAGLDTLVASGLSLEEALAFLPSVLATAQATGSATEDIANTAIKASSALNIEATKMQNAFDIMVAGGKAGQFELKDMAQYIPELANSFASLGYTGEEGLKMLIALLQTLREDTGSAGAAATQLQNIFGKMQSEETINRFKKFGVNLTAEMEKAKAAGEDAVSAFVRLSKEALKGDLSKLPLLFSDQEFRLGMQSLITSADALEKFINVVNGAEVNGSTFRDLNVVLSDTQAKIDRMSNSFDRMMKSIGAGLSGPASSVMEGVAGAFDLGVAIDEGLKKRGMGAMQRNLWKMTHWNTPEYQRVAREGGYIDPSVSGAAEAAKNVPIAYQVLGRRPARPHSMTPDGAYGQASAPINYTAGMNVLSGIEAKMDAVAAKVDAINPHLADMTGQAGGSVDAVITDARQDNRQFPISVSAPVTVNVSQPTAAPGAVGAAVAGAVGKGAAQGRAQLETPPAF